MAPVEALTLMPGGSPGETEYDTTAPPLLVGAARAQVELSVQVSELGEYVNALGGTSCTAIEMLALVLPLLFVAVTLYVAADESAEAVPPMAPVGASSARPAGRVGATEYDMIVPPLCAGAFSPQACSTVQTSDEDEYARSLGASTVLLPQPSDDATNTATQTA